MRKPVITIFVLIGIVLIFGGMQPLQAQTKSDTLRWQPKVEKPTMIQSMVGYLDSLDGIRETIVNTALPFIGTPYHYASTGPASFDCSGFVKYVFSCFNMLLPHSAALQAQMGKLVKFTEAIKGDLMFFGYHSKDGTDHISHVAMVYSNKDGIVEMIHASTSDGVRIDRTDDSNWNNYWSKKFLFVKRLME